MEPLSDTIWDVVLAGTGLPQSLLALALSRSGRKVLHVDQNDYYGGGEAALSLQEAEAWVEAHSSDASIPFRNAVLERPEPKPDGLKLGFSRAYSLSLSPHLIYTRSNLLPALVSSKVYRQLEFLAVGSWYYYHDEADAMGAQEELDASDTLKRFRRIPGGREDVFSDKSIDLRSARSLMRFLKIAAEADNHAGILDEWGDKSFREYLSSAHKMPLSMQEPLFALTLSPFLPVDTSTSFALSEIHRHLTSIGMFGPGFGSVIPKWGGLAEVAQVACRAGAVGGGVYVLGQGIRRIDSSDKNNVDADASREGGASKNTAPLSVHLNDGSTISAYHVVGTSADLPSDTFSHDPPQPINSNWVERSITIVSSPLSFLFPQPDLDSAPPPACTIIVFPAGSLDSEASQVHAPIHLAIHSSDTGECPAGQCIIYAQSHPSTPRALLSKAVETLLSSTAATGSILLTLSYQHLIPTPPSAPSVLSPGLSPSKATGIGAGTVLQSKILLLPSIPPSFVLEDEVLSSVRAIWDVLASNADAGADGEQGVKDDGASGFGKFMQFADRPGESGEDEEEVIGAPDGAEGAAELGEAGNGGNDARS